MQTKAAKAYRKQRVIEVLTLREPVARELRLVERDAEARAGRKREDARAEVEFFGGDVVHRLERPDAFQPVDHVRADGGEHDLRHGVHAQPESVPDDAAHARGFGGGEHGGGAVEPALLHDFELDDGGGARPDHRDQAGVVENRFVRHDGNAARFAAHARHPGEIAGGDRLLEELEVAALHQARKAYRRVRVVARVRVDAQHHRAADRLAHRLDAVAVGLDAPAHLDLRRAEAALEPQARLGRGLLGRKNPDPGVERKALLYRAPEVGVHRHAERARGEIHAGHLDRRLGVEKPRRYFVETRVENVDVRGIPADHAG